VVSRPAPTESVGAPRKGHDGPQQFSRVSVAAQLPWQLFTGIIYTAEFLCSNAVLAI
jgi:hypothetical protein